MTIWTQFSLIIKPSTLGGVGVFATHAISAGTQVFAGMYSPRKWRIKDIPAEFVKYCILLNEEECLGPERFDRMEIAWYVNHSDQPNIERRSDNDVIACRDIQAGDEILLDYNQLHEPEHLKEGYYRRVD